MAMLRSRANVEAQFEMQTFLCLTSPETESAIAESLRAFRENEPGRLRADAAEAARVAAEAANAAEVAAAAEAAEAAAVPETAAVEPAAVQT